MSANNGFRDSDSAYIPSQKAPDPAVDRNTHMRTVAEPTAPIDQPHVRLVGPPVSDESPARQPLTTDRPTVFIKPDRPVVSSSESLIGAAKFEPKKKTGRVWAPVEGDNSVVTSKTVRDVSEEPYDEAQALRDAMNGR